MKHDLDLVRKILLACEEKEKASIGEYLKFEGYTEEQVGFHVHLMGEAGLLEVVEVGAGDQPPLGIPLWIKWEGYEFLEASRNETTWKKVRGTVKCAVLQVIKTVLIREATDQGIKAFNRLL